MLSFRFQSSILRFSLAQNAMTPLWVPARVQRPPQSSWALDVLSLALGCVGFPFPDGFMSELYTVYKT